MTMLLCISPNLLIWAALVVFLVKEFLSNSNLSNSNWRLILPSIITYSNNYITYGGWVPWSSRGFHFHSPLKPSNEPTAHTPDSRHLTLTTVDQWKTEKQKFNMGKGEEKIDLFWVEDTNWQIPHASTTPFHYTTLTNTHYVRQTFACLPCPAVLWLLSHFTNWTAISCLNSKGFHSQPSCQSVLSHGIVYMISTLEADPILDSAYLVTQASLRHLELLLLEVWIGLLWITDDDVVDKAWWVSGLLSVKWINNGPAEGPLNLRYFIIAAIGQRIVLYQCKYSNYQNGSVFWTFHIVGTCHHRGPVPQGDSLDQKASLWSTLLPSGSQTSLGNKLLIQYSITWL